MDVKTKFVLTAVSSEQSPIFKTKSREIKTRDENTTCFTLCAIEREEKLRKKNAKGQKKVSKAPFFLSERVKFHSSSQCMYVISEGVVIE